MDAVTAIADAAMVPVRRRDRFQTVVVLGVAEATATCRGAHRDAPLDVAPRGTAQLTISFPTPAARVAVRVTSPSQFIVVFFNALTDLLCVAPSWFPLL